MANAVKNLLRKIRRTRLPKQPETELDRIIAEYRNGEAEKFHEELWERDKKIVRDANFEKAKRALQEYREAIQVEKDRQAAIAEQRLQSLKKARRALKRKRSSK
jgi:hypothetical protein